MPDATAAADPPLAGHHARRLEAEHDLFQVLHRYVGAGGDV